ncbi:MAG: hypothetical protein NVS3B12_06940 [Acidimicrobiales bacterium]
MSVPTGTDEVGGDRGRVLVADDSEVIRVVTARMVESLGYHSDVVCDGARALEAVLGGDYAAVLMDCQMPVMDGYESTAQIRQRELTGRHTPVIAVTAADRDGDVERCAAAGMDDYVTKPVSRSVLQATLGRWVRPSRAIGRVPAGRRAPIASAAVLDSSVVADLRELGRDGGGDIGEVLVMFRRRAAERIEVLGRAVASGDRDQLGFVAHSLKGSCAVFGATRLAGMSGDVEDELDRGNDLVDAAGIIVCMTVEFGLVCAELDAAFAVADHSRSAHCAK